MFLTTLQAGRKYNVHRDTVWHWIRHGTSTPIGVRARLQALKIGGRWKTTEEWLAAFFSACSGKDAKAVMETPHAAAKRAEKAQASARLILLAKSKAAVVKVATRQWQSADQLAEKTSRRPGPQFHAILSYLVDHKFLESGPDGYRLRPAV